MDQFVIFRHGIDRYPRLDTVLMIEEAVHKAKGDKTLRQIWLSLPKKTMWKTFLAAIDYLEYSGKLFVEEDGHPTWIWDPEGVKEILSKKHLVVRWSK